jgi:hypothetical protein
MIVGTARFIGALLPALDNGAAKPAKPGRAAWPRAEPSNHCRRVCGLRDRAGVGLSYTQLQIRRQLRTALRALARRAPHMNSR